MQDLPHDDGRRVDLPEVCIFDSEPYATAWDERGTPTAWARKSVAELREMAETDAHIRATGQPEPYIKPAHYADPVPGILGPIRFALEGGVGKLYAGVKRAVGWIADQVLAGDRPWRSAEILNDASAANYHGADGKPMLKSIVAGLALINEHPRKKQLHSDGVTRFAEPGAVPGSQFVTVFDAPSSTEEGCKMQLTAEQGLALLKALGGDQKLYEKAIASLAGDAAPDATPPEPAPMADKPAAPVVPMSDAAAKLQADLDLAKAQLGELRAQRVADVQLDRTRQIVAFSEKVSLTHGRAVADKAKAAVETRINLLPKTENFADGKDLVAEVFAEITGLLGPATRPSDPLAAGRPASMNGETFSEDTAREEIFAEANITERAYLQSPAGKSLLTTLVARRKAEHERTVR